MDSGREEVFLGWMGKHRSVLLLSFPIMNDHISFSKGQKHDS